MASLISVHQLSKSFPGVRALHEARFDLQAGEVHALMRRKRRRQIDPDENPGRGVPQGQWPDPA
jgi:hypothetical protein